MPSIKSNTTIHGLQAFTQEVYGVSNDRYFNAWDMLTNVERFLMRGLKGIRKEDQEKIELNLIISLSWYMSLMNQLHINLEENVWHRFPYVCSYCGDLPCSCKSKKVKKRQKITIDNKLRPKTLKEFQIMFEKIYPSTTRTLEHAGIHLAEEIGELSETVLNYRGSHKDDDFKQVTLEAADLFSCYIGVFNSLKSDLATKLSIVFKNNCHVCKKSPCECSFDKIMHFKF
ncbi:MAG: hypothetical protein M1429_04155 [Patescibacteria group bacterium]|nr:hypothetical protein [Patescibacteria group bacterium]